MKLRERITEVLNTHGALGRAQIVEFLSDLNAGSIASELTTMSKACIIARNDEKQWELASSADVSSFQSLVDKTKPKKAKPIKVSKPDDTEELEVEDEEELRVVNTFEFHYAPGGVMASLETDFFTVAVSGTRAAVSEIMQHILAFEAQ